MKAFATLFLLCCTLLLVATAAERTPGKDGDTVEVLKHTYDPSSRLLYVLASSSSPSASLEVFAGESDRSLGKLQPNGEGQHEGSFALERSPGTITIRSSCGGSATVEVEAL